MWIKGEVLDFQLQKDGTLEFDDYPVDTAETVRAEDVRKRKRYVVSLQEVSEISEIIQSRDFLAMKERYELAGTSCDAHYDRAVDTETKSVRVPFWCGPENHPQFPAPLLQLFERVRVMKSSTLGRMLPTP